MREFAVILQAAQRQFANNVPLPPEDCIINCCISKHCIPGLQFTPQIVAQKCISLNLNPTVVPIKCFCFDFSNSLKCYWFLA